MGSKQISLSQADMIIRNRSFQSSLKEIGHILANGQGCFINHCCIVEWIFHVENITKGSVVAEVTFQICKHSEQSLTLGMILL